MGGFLRVLVLAALAAGAVIWLRRGDGRIQLRLGEDADHDDREADRRRIRELAETVEQLRGELDAAKDAWRDQGQTDERLDTLWSERERQRELEARIAELEQARAADAARAEAEAAQLERISTALDALRDEVAAAHAQWQAGDTDREDRIDAVRQERARAFMLEQQLAQADGAKPPPPAWWELEPPTSFAELAEQVRASLPLIAFPDSALTAAAELDQSDSAQAWAAETWRGLGALSEYAARATRDPNAAEAALPPEWDFTRWCREGGHPQAWPPQRIGLDRARRLFAVDRGVNWSGQVVARTHLLVGDSADAASPVLFIHDDARGRSGQIHVVFLGPQRHAASIPGI